MKAYILRAQLSLLFVSKSLQASQAGFGYSPRALEAPLSGSSNHITFNSFDLLIKLYKIMVILTSIFVKIEMIAVILKTS